MQKASLEIWKRQLQPELRQHAGQIYQNETLVHTEGADFHFWKRGVRQCHDLGLLDLVEEFSKKPKENVEYFEILADRKRVLDCNTHD